MLDHEHYGIMVTYHAVFMCDFELTQDNYKKIFEKCVAFLCDSLKNWSTKNTHNEKLSVAMVLRIIGNFIALRSHTDNALDNFIALLALQNETLPSIIDKMFKIDSVYKNEIFWFAGNIYQVNTNYRDEIVSTLMMLK